MNPFRHVLCLLSLAAATLIGCKPTGVIQLSGSDLPRPVQVLRHHSGSDPGFRDPVVLLINSDEELDSLGSYTLTGKVDFRSESVIVLALGEKPTSGYWAQITSVQRKGNVLFVQGTANRPREDQPVAQVLNYPYDAVVIKKIYSATVRSEIESVLGKPQPESWGR